MGKAEISYEEIEVCTPEEVRRVEVDKLKGFQDIIFHIVFDVKMDFTCKTRYVTNWKPLNYVYIQARPYGRVL